MRSDSINELAEALAKAQSEMKPAAKDGKNPHLKNSYATLDSIIETTRHPLSSNGLSFSQLLQQGDTGLLLETFLLHSSGQWLQSEVLVTPSTGNRGINEMQALGSALTYLKRYALAAMLGISVDIDDDGNNANIPQKQINKVDFFTKATKEFNLSASEISQILKDAGFTNGYDPANAPEYWEAIIAAT